mgnify:CR=1 FL=1
MNSFKINKIIFNHIYRVLQDYKFVASALCNCLYVKQLSKYGYENSKKEI